MTSAQRGRNFFLVKAVLSANSIAYYAGSVFSWTSPVIPMLKSNDSSINPLSRPITLLEDTWLSSGVIIGSILGPLVSALFDQKFGRKKTLVLFSITILATFGSFIFIKNILWFLIARVIMGIGAGSILSLLPTYTGEITDDSNRGRAGSIFGVMFTTGHIINYCIGPFVSFQLLNLIHLIPLLIFYLLFVPFIPESPYYYISKNDEEGAKRSLRKFRGHPAIGKELEEIKLSIEKTQNNQCRFVDVIKSRVVLKGLMIACGLLICQPLTGFGVVIAYLQTIFEANKNFISPEYSVMIIGFCPFLTTISTTFFVEKMGRKTLLLISSVGATICLLFLSLYLYLQNNNYNVNAISWLPLLLVIIYLVSSNIGFASIPWMMSGEMFSSNVRSLGTSIASSAYMLVTLLVVAIFPYLSESMGMSGSFLIYAGLSVLVIIFILVVVPETKGKSFAEIQELLKPKNKLNNYLQNLG